MTSPLSQLLTQLVDYAGLFPPAGLQMERAVENYARYLSGSERWMLGRFIVPVARLDAFERAAQPYLGNAAWQISALTGADLDTELDAIAKFNACYSGKAVIDSLEAKAASVAEIEALDSNVPRELELFIEVPVGDEPAALIAAISRAGRRAKIRTGGLTEDAFPAASRIARFLVRCAEQNVAFKATAGLHHPVRCMRPLTYEPSAPTGTMHGFLNVFLSAAHILEGAGTAVAEAILLEERADHFRLGDNGISWNGETLTADAIGRARQSFAISFGSCSFEEPIEDLKQLGWMPQWP